MLEGLLRLLEFFVALLRLIISWFGTAAQAMA